MITTLLCQDMVLAIAPRSIFEPPVGTKVGVDQSPVPEGIVTEFIKWAQDNGAVIEEGENRIRMLKKLDSIELKQFKKDDYTVCEIGNGITFVYNGEKKSDAYILRDNEGNRYVTEAFYSHYVKAPPGVRFQELLHEVFEYEWNRRFGARGITEITQGEIEGLWDAVFLKLEDVDSGLYKRVFTRRNIEEFLIPPVKDIGHVLAELAEKLSTLINAGEEVELSLNYINQKVKMSDLDQFIDYIESLPIRDSLERALEAGLRGEVIGLDPNFSKFINEHSDGVRGAIVELSCNEIRIFLEKWLGKKYPLIKEEDLRGRIEDIVNRWLLVYKRLSIEERVKANDPVTVHYSVWENSCVVEDLLIMDSKCYLSLDILNRKVGFVIPLLKEGERIFPIFEGIFIGEVKYDTFLIQKFRDLKGELDLRGVLQDPKCRSCIGEMMAGLGWETLVQVFIRNEEFLGVTHQEMEGFLQDLREEIKPDEAVLKGAYPRERLYEYTEEIQPSICITKSIGEGLAVEIISVLEELAVRVPGVRDTIVSSLIERIRTGKVFLGRHFTRPATAVESARGGGKDYFILINHNLEDALNMETPVIDNRSIRGIFLASLLLGQEAQIYMRRYKDSNWDVPEFNSAFIAQAAELQVLALYKDIPDFIKQFVMYEDSLTTNSWGEINLADAISVHSGVRNEGCDYQFLEGRVSTILIYKEVLNSLGLAKFNVESLKAASFSNIHELLREIGLAPIMRFGDLPPETEGNVSVIYRNNVNRDGLIADEELIRCVKDTFIPLRQEGRGALQCLGDMVDKGFFAGLVIEVDPQVRRIQIRLDIKTLRVYVTVPEVRDAGAWQQYCDTFEIIPGEKLPVVYTNLYEGLSRERDRNLRAIEEAQQCGNEGDIDRALRIIQRRLDVTPMAAELIFFMAQVLLPRKGELAQAFGLIHNALRDQRLYLRGQCEILLRFISTALMLENLKTVSGDIYSMGDIIHLAEIARTQLGQYLRDVEKEREEMRTRRMRFESALARGAARKELLEYQIGILDAGEAQGREEEQRIRGVFKNIATAAAMLCFNRGYYMVVDYWLREVEPASVGREHKGLLSRAWMSFTGGAPLDEGEIRRIFEIYDDWQRKNPVDCDNLAVWAYNLYSFWRYKYPERREYLEEAERRYEQYIILSPIHMTISSDYLYYLGLVKYYLGKTREAFLYLEQFFSVIPRQITSKLTYLEGRALLRRLAGEREKKPGQVLLMIQRGHKASRDVINDLVDNYLSPFVVNEFETLKPEDRHRLVYIYLRLLRSAERLEEAYRQARKWLEGSADTDLIEELIKIAVLLGKDDEVKEILQERLATSREKDIILEYCQALILKQKGELIPSLKLLNSLAQRYMPRPREKVDDIRGKILANIFVERADIFNQLGQFTLAKRDWEYINEKGWRRGTITRHNIALTEQLEDSCKKLVMKIYEGIDVERYPDVVIERMREILREYPHNRHALRVKNSIMSFNGRFEDAEREYLSIFEVYPDNIEFWLDLAFCSLMAISPKAYEYYREYEKAGGDIRPILNEFGRACVLAERWEEAIRYLNMYIDTIKLDSSGFKSIFIDICINLVISYEKLNRWEEAYNALAGGFKAEDAKAHSANTRKQVARLLLDCCLAFIRSEKPDWDRIEILKGRISIWMEGLEMDGDLRKLDDEIEIRRLEIEEREAGKERERTTEQRRRQLDLRVRTVRNRIQELRVEVIEEARLAKLDEEIRMLINSAESEAAELEQDTVRKELEGFRQELPGVLEKAKARLRERNRAIDRLKRDIAETRRDLLGGNGISETAVKALFSSADVLGIRDRPDIVRLLDELKSANDLANEERKRKERQERLWELNERFDVVEREVREMVEMLQGLAPGEDPQPVLDKYRQRLAGFIGVKAIGELRDTLKKTNWPEEFIARILGLDNLFMGRYGQAKGRKKLKAKQAFDVEIGEALIEMEAVPIPKDGSIIARRKEIHDLLWRLVERVLHKYNSLPDFRLTPLQRRRVIRRVEERIATLIRVLEEQEEVRRIEEEQRDEEEEEKRIGELLKRQHAIQAAVDEWTDFIQKEIAAKTRKDVDFELIWHKGEELAGRLEKDGIFLTYEEAFNVQNRILRVINPHPARARFGWDKVYPVVQAISISKNDMPRAKEEVDRCFQRPQIDEVDERIFSILNGDDTPPEILEYMKRPASSVARLLAKESLADEPVKCFWLYWHTANNSPKETKNWGIRLGRTQELLKAGIIKDPRELIMVQIHLLRCIYTDDPENHLDPDSKDYAYEAARAIARRFSGKDASGGALKEPREFLYDLEGARLKLVPRQEPVSESSDTGEEVSWIRRNLGMHRHLTPDETRSLILLAQKGNPIAMNILKQAHAITILSEAMTFAKRTGSFEELNGHINNGFLGFSKGVLRYGYHLDEGRYIEEEERFGLHIINPNFLNWIRLPIKSMIERSAMKQRASVTESFGLQEEKKLLGKARRQVYKDIGLVRSLSALLEKDKDRIKKIKKNIPEEAIARISLAAGLKPLEVLALLTNCPVEELNEMAEEGLAKGSKDKARFAGMASAPELADIFKKVLKAKNINWRRQDAHDLLPIAGVLLGERISSDVLSEVWWIKRRRGDIEEDDLEGFYIDYLKRLYSLLLDAGNGEIGKTDIAPIVEYIVEIQIGRQSELETMGVLGLESLDEPVGGDSDTTGHEITDLGEFVDQIDPAAELERRLTPTAVDIRNLPKGAFEELREKALRMLNRLEERLMGERKKKIERLRPIWEEGLARIETGRSQVRDIEGRLDMARREKLSALGGITKKMDGIMQRHEAGLQELLAEQRREMDELSARHGREMDGIGDGRGLTTVEKRAHGIELRREVIDYIDSRELEIQREYNGTVGMLEDNNQVAVIAARRENKDILDGLDGETAQIRSRHESEIHTARLRAEPEEMEVFYPDFPEEIEKGSVPFNREFWELILRKINTASPEDLMAELKGVEVFTQLLEKSRIYQHLHLIQLIATVFVPLSFDRRLWELIDQNELELRVLNIRLNYVKQGSRPQIDGFYDEGYGIQEAEIFSEQLVVLAKIVDRYKVFLKTQARSSVAKDELIERHSRELEDKEEEVRRKKEVEERRFQEVLDHINRDKVSAIEEAARRRDEKLAALDEERELRLTRAKEEHRRWIRYSRREAMEENHRREITRLENAHAEARGALEAEQRKELAPVKREHEIALADLDNKIERELGELAEAIRRQEEIDEALRHDIEQISRAIAAEREAILQGNTDEDRALIESHHAEWEEFVDLVGRRRIGTLYLNGYPFWDADIVRDALNGLLARATKEEKRKKIQKSLTEVDRIAQRQAGERAQLKERQSQRFRELEGEEDKIRGRAEEIQRGEEGLFRMRERLFTSEKYIAKWLEEEMILLGQMERDFEPLNRRYQELEQSRQNFERAKSMYLDRMGLSSAALESGGPMHLEAIAQDPRYRKPDGTPITRERVRQILKKLHIQLSVFSDFDEVDLEDVSYFEKPRDIGRLLMRLGISPQGEEGMGGEEIEDFGRFYISRSELLQLLRTIIEAQKDDTTVDENVLTASLDILRLFIIKNQMPGVDIYRIIAEISQQLIDALEPSEVTLLCFRECMGEMRIRLLRESQMGSAEKALGPYDKNVLSSLEARFIDDYEPFDEFPYFPTADKSWLSRDELIRLGLTWKENPGARDRIRALLNKFAERQDEMYPDSGIEEVVRELTGIEIFAETDTGLIGKYRITSGIRFIEEQPGTQKGYIEFRAYSTQDPERREIPIRIDAEKVHPMIFNNFRRTGIPEIDTKMEKFLAGFGGDAFLLGPNLYGIDGIGTENTLSVLESFKDNTIALFHELAHAAGVDVTGYIRPTEHRERVRQHYALRAFQRQQWRGDDQLLTRLIRIDSLRIGRGSIERNRIARRLGLDTRPIQNRLLGIQYVGHNMAVKAIVNPDNGHRVAVYGCSGADWSNLILSTNADTVYFVDRTPIDAEKLERLLAAEWDRLNDVKYLNYKYRFGYSYSANIMAEIEYKILLELKCMGVKRDTIKITSNTDGSVTISFEWAYKGEGQKGYTITYIKADITNSEYYPEGLKKILEDGIDIYYQRAAGLDIPGLDSEFVQEIAKNIREGGYILIDGVSNKIDDIYTEELRHWEDLMQVLVSGAGSAIWYGRFVKIRQKRDVVAEDIGFTKRLLEELKEGRIYEVRYDARRLGESQQELIREYCIRLNARAIPVMDAEEDYIIRVTCRDRVTGEIGTGQINIEGRDELRSYPLRIIGMLNIAFAVSSIRARDDPLTGFIREQYKAITGHGLSEDADIRRIILPRPVRIDLDEANRLNQIAMELLISA